MTRSETFKKRVRERMAHTGERYGAARRVLIEQAAARRGRTWVDQPELSDEQVREATGRGWDEWCDAIEAWGGQGAGHAAIATYLRDELEVGGWWAQGITVGFERISGARARHQMADGTFTANKSRTVAVDGELLRRLLLDADERAGLLPDVETELRSRPTSKAIRLAAGPGVALISLDPAGGGRTKVTVSHEKLPTRGDVEVWKEYWTRWLAALDAAGG